MIHSARQLKDKIRNLAFDKSADAQVLLHNYMMERFLERVSDSSYRENFILKGGMLVASMVGLETRSTMDIDATVKGKTVSIEAIQRMVEDIISLDLSHGVSFTIGGVSEIMDEAEYPGVRITIVAYMDGIKVPLKVDISTGGCDYASRYRIYSYRLMFEDCAIRLLSYNLETVLAEKLETIVLRTTTNTRMRDFYDIHILLTLYRKDIDPTTMKNALLATSKRRTSLELLNNAEKVLTDLRDSDTMKGLWENYKSKFNYAKNISWTETLTSVRELAVLANLQVERLPATERLDEIKLGTAGEWSF